MLHSLTTPFFSSIIEDIPPEVPPIALTRVIAPTPPLPLGKVGGRAVGAEKDVGGLMGGISEGAHVCQWYVRSRGGSSTQLYSLQWPSTCKLHHSLYGLKQSLYA